LPDLAEATRRTKAAQTTKGSADPWVYSGRCRTKSAKCCAR
jgi:hypothetical protein